MAPHVLPMLLDKLGSEVSTAKEASLRALVAGVRAFGTPGVGKHLRAIGAAMFEEVRERREGTGEGGGVEGGARSERQAGGRADKQAEIEAYGPIGGQAGRKTGRRKER